MWINTVFGFAWSSLLQVRTNQHTYVACRQVALKPKNPLETQDWHQLWDVVRSSVGDDLEIWVNLLQILEFVKQLASCDPKQIKTRPGEYWTQYDDSNCFWWCAGLHSQCKVNSLTWEQNNSFTISIHFILIRLAACGWTCLGVPLNSKCKRFLSKLRSWDDGHFGYRPNVAGIMTVQKDSGGWDLSTQSSDLKTRNMLRDELARGFRNICASLFRLKWAQVVFPQMLSKSNFATGGKHCLCTRSQKHVQHTFSSLHHLVIEVHPWDPLGCWTLEAAASNRTLQNLQLPESSATLPPNPLHVWNPPDYLYLMVSDTSRHGAS